MDIKPSSFIKMINQAESAETVEHIYNCVDELFGYEFSPKFENERQEWRALINAKNSKLNQLGS